MGKPIMRCLSCNCIGIVAILLVTSCAFPNGNSSSKGLKIEAYAGTGTSGLSGNGSSRLYCEMKNPSEAVFNSSGALLFADWGNNEIREVLTTGEIVSIAGTGVQGYSGDGGKASLAQLSNPTSVATDSSGNVYISDWGNNVIRKIDVQGNISTIAGTGVYGYTGDKSAATSAQINGPEGLTVDSSADVYFADTNNNVIRKIDTHGIITTVVGSGSYGYSGDTSDALACKLRNPTSVIFDSTGNMYISDFGNGSIRKVDINNIITTIAGNGFPNYSGDGGKASSAQLNDPYQLAIDSLGNIYVADSSNNRIREINTNGRITTVAGSSLTGGNLGDNGSATLAELNYPTGVAVDSSGNLYVCDNLNNRIREVVRNTISQSSSGTDQTETGSTQNEHQ